MSFGAMDLRKVILCHLKPGSGQRRRRTLKVIPMKISQNSH